MSILSPLSVFGFYIVFVLLFVQRFMKLRQTRKQWNPFYQASDDCTPIHTNNNFVVLGFASPVTSHWLHHMVCDWSLASLASVWQAPGAMIPDTSLSNWRVQGLNPLIHLHHDTARTICSLIHSSDSAAFLSRSHQSQILMTVRVRWAAALNLF